MMLPRMSKCIFIKPGGEQCQANSVIDSDFCFTHDPNSQRDKLLAVTKGGLNRRHYQEYGEPVDITSPEDIKNLLSRVINGVWTGEIPANQPANSIAYLAKCWLDAYGAQQIEERIVNLEKTIAELSSTKTV